MTKMMAKETTMSQYQRDAGKELHPALSGPCRCRDLGVPPSTRDDRRSPSYSPQGCLQLRLLQRLPLAHRRGRRLRAEISLQSSASTVYFVALNTLTARRHTLALKRLRTTALPSVGIVAGLLVPPLLVGVFQVVAVFTGLVVLGAPLPQSPCSWYVSAARNDNCDAGRRGNEWVNRHT